MTCNLLSENVNPVPQTVVAAHEGHRLIHVGYHRTATSFFQTEVFPLCPTTTYLRSMAAIERYLANPSSGLTIISNESLSSDLERDKPELAARLAKKLPGARIFISIRSQYTIMRSIYHLHTKGGGKESYESFVAARCGRLFNYIELVEAYRNSFGIQNVLVLPQELLERDPLTTIETVLKFAGVDPSIAEKVNNRRVKASAGDATMAILRCRNQLIAPFRWVSEAGHSKIIHRGFPGARVIDQALGAWFRLPMDRVRPLIGETYGEGNTRLFASLGINGADYDYPLPRRA